MVNLGVIAEDSTTRFYMSTSIATGAAADMSASLEQADFVIMKDGAAMTLDASSIIPTNITTGIYEVDIDTSVDADFTKGSTYWVYFAPSDETLDSVDVAAVLGCFTIESASEQAIRRLRENIAITDTLTTQTGVSDNTAVNLTGLVDAQSANDLFNGWLGLLRDETDGQCYLCRITDFTNTNLLATIASATGATLPTPASGDKFWLLGAAGLHPTVPGRTFDVSTGGEGGVDWANVGTAGSTVALSATTVATVTTTATVTAVTTVNGLAANVITAAATAADFTTEVNAPVIALLPAALVGGRMDATVDGTGMESGAVDVILDEQIGDSTVTMRQALRLLVAALGGKASGLATTTATYRNAADNTNVIVATVDADGNRTAVTLTL